MLISVRCFYNCKGMSQSEGRSNPIIFHFSFKHADSGRLGEAIVFVVMSRNLVASKATFSKDTS